MPELQPVWGAGNGRPAGHLKLPLAAEAYLDALYVERAGYQARLDRGETHYGGESIAEIMARIDAQLPFPEPAPAAEVPYEVVADGETLAVEDVELPSDDVPRLDPAKVEAAMGAVAAASALRDDDVPPPVKRRRA